MSEDPEKSPRRKSARSPITSESEREQALRDYKLTIEYKHLKQHSPSGVYLLPSPASLRLFHGVIFLRRGMYSNAIFKFTMELPQGYNDINTFPKITFDTKVYNPHVSEQGILDLTAAYTKWDPHRHYLVTVLTFLKKIFYIKNYGDGASANLEARELSRSHPAEFKRNVVKCVKESQRGLFINEPGSSMVFKEENECHVALRMLMKDKFKDPAMVGRTMVIDCVEEAQKIGQEKVMMKGKDDSEEGGQ